MATLVKKPIPAGMENEPAKEIPFEQKRRGFHKLAHTLLIRVLNVMPRPVAEFLFVLSSSMGEETRTVAATASTYLSLEVIYTFPEKHKEGKATLSGWIWWNTLDNARAVYNRLLLVKRELATAILCLANQKQSIGYLGIGAGSARAMLETAAAFGNALSLRTMLLDRDPEALDFAKNLAKKLDLNHTQWVEGDFFRVKKVCGDFQPDIVEMVGLLDYMERRQAVLLLKQVFNILQPGGILLTGNICPNIEAPYVEKGVKWPPMVHREPAELADILCEAGFVPQSVSIYTEPIGIHVVAVARKARESMV